MVKRSHPSSPTDTPSPASETRNGSRFSPYGGQVEQGSAIYRMKLFIENLFSYRSVFWLGIGIAVVAFGFNALFYFGLATNVFGWGFIGATLGALVLAFGTSLFQLMPELQTTTARMSLHQIFVAGSKPKLVPVLDPNVVADYQDLIADYRQTEVNRRAFFKMARRGSFLVEAILGVLFIGNIGAGIGAFFSLVFFGLSVWGVEAGVKLALKAGEDDLSPQIKQQLKNLLENDGRDLQLSHL